MRARTKRGRIAQITAALFLGAFLGGFPGGFPGGFLGGSLGPALALEPEERLGDPALEARAREISKGLRCVVCQNQSIDDSDAQIAGDMRKLVRERLLAGDSDAAVLDRMVAYYGEYVLLQPRFSVKKRRDLAFAAPDPGRRGLLGPAPHGPRRRPQRRAGAERW